MIMSWPPGQGPRRAVAMINIEEERCIVEGYFHEVP